MRKVRNWPCTHIETYCKFKSNKNASWDCWNKTHLSWFAMFVWNAASPESVVFTVLDRKKKTKTLLHSPLATDFIYLTLTFKWVTFQSVAFWSQHPLSPTEVSRDSTQCLWKGNVNTLNNISYHVSFTRKELQSQQPVQWHNVSFIVFRPRLWKQLPLYLSYVSTKLRWNCPDQLWFLLSCKAPLQCSEMMSASVFLGRQHPEGNRHQPPCEGGLWESRPLSVPAAEGVGTRLVWQGTQWL